MTLRHGVGVMANDLNQVAAITMKAGLEIPHDLALSSRREIGFGVPNSRSACRPPLTYFWRVAEERVVTYIFVGRSFVLERTSRYLVTELVASRGSKPTAVRASHGTRRSTTRRGGIRDRQRSAIDFDPDKGTVAGGDGMSPWDGLAIDGEYIKAEAQQAGWVASYTPWQCERPGAQLPPPTAVTLSASRSGTKVERRLPDWLTGNVMPTSRSMGLKYIRVRPYGMNFGRNVLATTITVMPLSSRNTGTRAGGHAALDGRRADAVTDAAVINSGKDAELERYSSSWDVAR